MAYKIPISDISADNVFRVRPFRFSSLKLSQWKIIRHGHIIWKA